MSVQINIGGTIIEFPSSAQSPNWAPSLIEFAQVVEASLSGVVGPYDIAPQVVDLLNDGAEHEVSTPTGPLAFPTAAVRSAIVRYSIYRTNTPVLPLLPETHAESGTLTIVYNPLAATGQKWEIQREFIGNVTPQGTYGNVNPVGTCTAGVLFRIDDSGQIWYKADTIYPTSYVGKLSFAAQALLQTS